MAIRLSYILLSCAVLFLGCSKGYKKAESGLEYQFFIENKGVQKPNVGEVLHINYKVQNSDGEELFSTSAQRKGEPEVITLEKTHYAGDYFEALGMMSLGDSAIFLLDANQFYKKYLNKPLPENVKTGSKLILTVRLLKILTQAQSEEIKNKEKFEQYEKEYAIIANYMEAKGLKYQTTEEGIKYQLTGAKGASIEEGDKVTFQYIGKLLNDEEFINTYKNNAPGVIEVGQEYEIDFYNMILPLMSAGQKGTFIIPFVYAFGEKGVKDRVPPFAPVLYEVEIINVEKNKK